MPAKNSAGSHNALPGSGGAMTGRVVITGAARGLGRALTTCYLEQDDEVWAGCRAPGRAADLAARGAHVCRLDVSDEEVVIQFASQVAAAGNVDLLINAAGTDARAFGAPPGRRGPFEISAEHFLAEVQVNAVGPMLVTRALLPQLINGTPGKIVNLSSRLASMTIGAEICWDIGYNASKAALNAITVRTARLLAPHGVVVAAIHPGWVRTDMGGQQASLDPEDAARQLADTIAGLAPQHSGMFLHSDGTPHPW
jgi:NAD(P)-dependent dehydrogenase (short-subunit alcohol dehydrogenase family)